LLWRDFRLPPDVSNPPVCYSGVAVNTPISLILALAAAMPALPQNPPSATAAAAPNAAGVSFLHIHLYVRNVDAQRSFWLALAGGPQEGRGVRVGTASISITPGEPKGGNAGSAIENVTFRVKDLKDTLARLDAAGGKRMPGGSASSAFVLAPEDIKIELIEDRTIEGVAAYDRVQLNLKSTAEALPWHQKVLGAVAAPGGWTIPGTIVRVTEGKTAPTSKGTSLDHIAFDVGDLEGFLKRLDAAHVSYLPVTKIANGTRGYTYVMDPGGVYMELMGALPAAR
jgi:catechol 2,3-dioxygenase-like lactoylglutathione lyase family enzyme